jgi:hypothetical protein
MRCSARDAKFATVLISEAKFVVHEELLIYCSSFFRVALNGNSEEAVTKTVCLGETDTETFAPFVHWLYHQHFPNEHDAPGLFEPWESLVQHRLIYLHVCNKYDLPELRRLTVDLFFWHQSATDANRPDPATMRHTFKHLREHLLLCQCIIDLSRHYANPRCGMILKKTIYRGLS